MKAFVLNHPCGIRFDANLTLETARKFVGEEVAVRELGNGWVWLDFAPICIEGKEIGANLSFFEGALKMIRLYHSDSELYGVDWGDWSAQKERTRARNTEAWLNKLGYYPGTNEWGSIWCGYDEKSGSGYASIAVET